MKYLAILLPLLLATPAFAGASVETASQAQPQAQGVQDLMARAALRASVEREQFFDQVDQLQSQVVTLQKQLKAMKDQAADDHTVD